MSRADAFREMAETLHMLGLATNNAKWHRLAERWSNRADSATHEITASLDPAKPGTASAAARIKNQVPLHKAA
jgi:hypothetical protein